MSKRNYCTMERGSCHVPAYVMLSYLGVIFLPFSQALTLDLGFPFKISEVMLLFAVSTFAVTKLLSRVQVPTKALVFGFLFLVVAAFSTLYSQVDSSHLSDIEYRGGFFIDGASRVIYLAFGILVMLLLYNSTLSKKELILQAWFVGLLLAVLYHIYIVISYVTTGDALMLPGIERHQLGWIGELHVPRSGSFKEGNFASLYYIASLMLAIHIKKKIYAVLSVVGLLLTLSTAGMAGLTVFVFVYYSLAYGLTYKWLLRSLVLVTIGVVAFIHLDVASKFHLDAGVSGGVRLNLIITGIMIFMENPVAGVGLGGYGYFFDYYEWNPELSVLSAAAKQIPNNVYVELLSEVGFLGTVLFLCFWGVWFNNALKIRTKYPEFLSFIISSSVVFVAFPTYNILYLWCFYGISLALMKSSFTR